MSTFYTYLWLREDGTPYYVGKGSGERGFLSEGHNVPCPKDKTRVITQDHPSESEAFEIEKFLTAYYGRKDLGTGCLRNRTDGGEGPANPSAEIRHRMSLGKKGNKNRLGTKHSRKALENMRAAQLNSERSKEHVLNMQRAFRQSSAYLAHQRAANQRANHKRWHVNRTRVVKECALCATAS